MPSPSFALTGRTARPSMAMWAAAMLALSACASDGGGDTEPAPTPGATTLLVSVSARPKAGVKAPRVAAVAGGYAEFESDESGRAFDRVDYRHLDGVVVWADPSPGEAVAAAPDVPLTFDGKPRADLTLAVGQGGAVAVRNSTPRSVTVYSLDEGHEFKLVVEPGAVGRWSPGSPGPVEVWASGVREPIATVYVAPSRFVRVARSGQTVVFSPMPSGPCRVGAWHPRLPAQGDQATLAPGQATRATVVLGVDAVAWPAGAAR